MSFFNELKRRNVIRVGFAYVITGWLIAQVAELASDSFGAPDWVMKMIITLLMLGAPIALVMAWAYELTPAGLRRESAETGQATDRPNKGKLDHTIIMALAAALAYFAYDKFVLDPREDAALVESVLQQSTVDSPADEPTESPPEVVGQSIAVLSFVNMSDDASNEYFSDGLSEELLNLLVRIPQLRVAARTSSFSFKGTNVQASQIARELNVTHILEGSVRKAGKQIRVTAQLIKADDGFQLWSETFHRQLDDIFVVQDEIAKAVVDALKINLLGAMPEPQKTDPEVYSLYLQGKHFNNLRDEENLEKAISAFKQALAIAPEYAPAWVGLSLSYSLQTGYRRKPVEQLAALSLAAIEKALALDPNMATAWSSLAYLKRSYEWDWQGARAAIEKALQLEPNNAKVIGIAGSVASTFGQIDKSIELFERNVELDPLRLSSIRALGTRYIWVGRYEEAIEQFRRVLALNPEYPSVQIDIAISYQRQGDYERAWAELNKAGSSNRAETLKAVLYFNQGKEAESLATIRGLLESSALDYPIRMAAIYAVRGENDSAFEWLEVALAQRDPSLSFILGSIALRLLASDPRLPVFLEKLNLRESWEAMPSEYGGPGHA